LPDGRVEAVFEEPDEAVKKIIDWCHEGSPHAIVTNVELADASNNELKENFTDFKITT